MKHSINKSTIFTLRAWIYKRLAIVNTIFLQSLQKDQIFILCYHSISSDGWRYGVTLEVIKKQIDYLVKQYQPITLSEIEDIISGKRKMSKPSFAITFDDGYKEIYQLKSYLKKQGIKPTFFVLSDIHPNFDELDTRRPFLSAEEIKSLMKDGWTLGNHSATHADFWNLSSQQITHEVITSKSLLEKKYGEKITYFAFPKGRYTKKVLQTVKKAGYTLGLSMNDGFINQYTNPFLVPRIGVDRTHTFSEFTQLMLPSSILFRSIIKRLPIGGLLS